MVLTEAEIVSKGIVRNAAPQGLRATTYDATVGTIYRGGEAISASQFKLPPRGIVWVVSAETFVLPDTVTGLATLRTTWTHDGVLALNVGIIDPGWDGPLAAALVNFGSKTFVIKKGEPFFRILFHEHGATGQMPVVKDPTTYGAAIMDKSKMFSRTFLDMDALVTEVSDRVLKLPQWAIALTILGLLLALLGIAAPIGYSVWTDARISSAKLDLLQKQVDDLKSGAATEMRLRDAERELSDLKKRQQRFAPAARE